MSANHQTQFLTRIRAALGKTADAVGKSRDRLFPQGPTEDQKRLLAALKNQTATQSKALLKKLVQVGNDNNITVTPVKNYAAAGDAIAQLVSVKPPEWSDQKCVAAWNNATINKLALEKRLASQEVLVHRAPLASAEAPQIDAQNRSDFIKIVSDALIGVTGADFCIADTATLVMRTRPAEARTVSLLPTIHVAVIHKSQIIADLKTLYTILRWDPKAAATGLTNCMTFITGPSKTADIEAIMVAGVHGPREVYLYVVTDEMNFIS